MTDLEKYQRINSCDSLNELAEVIESFADDNGMIQGRTKKFNASQMSTCCRNYSLVYHNTLTREFGIRQQAIMLLFYK